MLTTTINGDNLEVTASWSHEKVIAQEKLLKCAKEVYQRSNRWFGDYKIYEGVEGEQIEKPFESLTNLELRKVVFKFLTNCILKTANQAIANEEEEVIREARKGITTYDSFE